MILLIAGLCVLCILPAARADGTLYDFETPPRATRMWIPDGLPSVRGLLVQGNPWGGDARHYVNDQALRGFARLHGFAVVATAFWGRFEGDEILIWEQHLAALATLSGRPEVVHAPWAPLGFSNGGQMSYGLNALRPEKVIGFVANKGGYYNDPLPPEACLLTPGMLVAGELDAEFRRQAIRGLFQDNRPRGARWAWVEEQGMAHEGDAERLLLPFLAECVRLRYPPDQEPTGTSGVDLIELAEGEGWLADPTTWEEDLTRIAAYGEYPGDPATACWLPDAAVAHLYRAFATRTDGLQVAGGQVLDRDLHIQVPAFAEYWSQAVGLAPCLQLVVVDTADHPDWTRVSFYAGSELKACLLGSGTPQDQAAAMLVLEAGVHGLSALVTDQDGTVRTTGLRHRAVVTPVPIPPVPASSLAGLLLLLLVLSRRLGRP